MFETVGQTQDPEAAKRRAWASASTLLLVGVCSGLLTTTGLGVASRLDRPALDVTEMVEIVLTEPAPLSPLDLPEAPPAAPAAPTPETAAPPDAPPPEAPAPADPPDDDLAPDDPTPLDDLAEERELAYARTTTAQEGPPGGRPTAPGGGQETEPTQGAAPSNDDALRVQSRVQPEYPNLARNVGLHHAECICTVGVRSNGVPFSVDIDGCSRIFHGAARRALMGWRWERVPEALGDPVYTQIAIHFDRR